MVRKATFNDGFGGKHNDLFRPGPNSRLNACVGRNGGPADFGRYASGYFEAGARLVASLKNDPWSVDSLIYPLVMVYRHGIETGLKHLGRTLPPLCGQKSKIKLTHNLMDNWRFIRGLLTELGEGSELLDRVQSTLIEFIEIDPRGESFRYPLDRDGNRLLQETSLINVEVFAAKMEFMAQFFEGAGYWIDSLWEAQAEERAGA